MLKVVDLYANWCSPCKVQKPIIEEVANLYEGQVEFVEIDIVVDENKYVNVTSIPTIIFEKDEVILEQAVGLQSRDQLIAKIEQYK
jgi:thioredoxin 1